MNKTFVVAVLGLCAASASNAWAADSLKKISGGTLNGSVKSMSKTEVVFEKTTGASETVPITDIESLFFEGEGQLKLARNQIAAGSYSAALTTLEKISLGDSARPELKQELQFYKAYAKAKQGLEKGDKSEMGKGGQELRAFVTESPSNYHALVAYETLGDLLVALGKPEAAAPFYGELAQCPFPSYKLRGAVATGNSLIIQGKYQDALTQFDNVLSMPDDQKSPDVATQKMAAKLGKAVCQAGLGKVDEGIASIEQTIAGLDAEDDAALMAKAYVALGECYLKKPDQHKQALLAFLHVDVLYPTQVESEKKALARLSELWLEMKKPERAKEASERALQLTSGGSVAAE